MIEYLEKNYKNEMTKLHLLNFYQQLLQLKLVKTNQRISLQEKKLKGVLTNATSKILTTHRNRILVSASCTLNAALQSTDLDLKLGMDELLK